MQDNIIEKDECIKELNVVFSERITEFKLQIGMITENEKLLQKKVILD